MPILRAEITASLGMSEPSAGSDLASLRTRAVLDGDHFVVNGQKVWTSGAHDADVLLTFVRTDPDAPKHKGISALIIPTDTPGLVRRPFPSICSIDDKDFNEVFFTDVRVPAENLVGELNQGWLVANGSLGHERTMMWLGFADRLENMIADFRPGTEVERDQYATTIMDRQALRLLGSAALARAARGEDDVAAISVLKLLGSEAELRAMELALTSAGADGLVHPGQTGPYAHMNLDHYFASWFERYARSFSGTIAGAPRRSSATSSPSGCSACRAVSAVTALAESRCRARKSDSPRVPSWPASHGNAVAKAVPAVGQSWCPPCATTAQSMPLARPSAHSEAAAAAWSPGSVAARPATAIAVESTSRRGDGEPVEETANHPDTPV